MEDKLINKRSMIGFLNFVKHVGLDRGARIFLTPENKIYWSFQKDEVVAGIMFLDDTNAKFVYTDQDKQIDQEMNIDDMVKMIFEDDLDCMSY